MLESEKCETPKAPPPTRCTLRSSFMLHPPGRLREPSHYQACRPAEAGRHARRGKTAQVVATTGWTLAAACSSAAMALVATGFSQNSASSAAIAAAMDIATKTGTQLVPPPMVSTNSAEPKPAKIEA